MNGTTTQSDNSGVKNATRPAGATAPGARFWYAPFYIIITRISFLVKRFHHSFRYKLLLLVLLPLLIFVPIILAFALYRTYSFSQQQLHHKVNTDINMAMLAFSRRENEYLHAITELAESHVFYTAYQAHDKIRISNLLKVLKVTEDLDFVHVMDLHGKWLYDDEVFSGETVLTPLVNSVIRSGQPRVALEIYSAADLLREHQKLVEKAGIVDNDHLNTISDKAAEYAMVLRAVYPIDNEQGQTVALLEGGVLVNNNATLITAMKSMVFGPQTPVENEKDLISIVLGNKRIATNLYMHASNNKIPSPSILPDDIAANITKNKHSWAGLVQTPGGQYLCAYTPLHNFQGKIIGMLETGYLAAPLRTAYRHDINILILLLIVIVIFTAGLAILGARSIFKPIERIAEVIRAQENGIDQRIGPINSQDEISAVARRFDHMLDLLHERNSVIQHAAEDLERQVEARTHELQRKNQDLQHTIDLLGKTRQQLVWAEKFAALGELTAGIAHEINNPSAVIVGNMDVLKDELGDRASEYKTEIDLIYAQVDRIRSIIDKLLKYSRSAPLDTKLQDVDVNKLIKDSILLVRHEVILKQADIYTFLQDDCSVTIDPQELQQVLINLLLNAIHAISREGKIDISTFKLQNADVCIHVSDNGTGIDPLSIDSIFDPFFTTKSTNGTGLGLSISYGLIHRYGGRLEVDSTPAHGTTFRDYLRKHPKLTPQQKLFFDLYSHSKTTRGINQ